MRETCIHFLKEWKVLTYRQDVISTKKGVLDFRERTILHWLELGKVMLERNTFYYSINGVIYLFICFLLLLKELNNQDEFSQP